MPFVIHHVTMIFFYPLSRVCQKQRDNNSSSSQVSNLKNAYVIHPLSWKLLLIRKTMAINRDDHHQKLHSHYFTLSMHFLVDRDREYCNSAFIHKLQENSQWSPIVKNSMIFSAKIQNSKLFFENFQSILAWKFNC